MRPAPEPQACGSCGACFRTAAEPTGATGRCSLLHAIDLTLLPDANQPTLLPHINQPPAKVRRCKSAERSARHASRQRRVRVPAGARHSASVFRGVCDRKCNARFRPPMHCWAPVPLSAAGAFAVYKQQNRRRRRLLGAVRLPPAASLPLLFSIPPPRSGFAAIRASVLPDYSREHAAAFDRPLWHCRLCTTA